MESRPLDGKVALVACASNPSSPLPVSERGGIGYAVARAFAEAGAHLVVADVDDEAGRALVRTLSAEGRSVEFESCDVGQSEDVTRCVARITEHHARLDVAANVVGGAGGRDRHGVELHEQAADEWESTLAFSLVSTMRCMRHEIAAMLAAGGGAIVNVTSMAGVRVTFDATPAYVAAKAAINHVTRYAAVAYADRAIRVNAVAPGVAVAPKSAVALGEERVAAMLAGTHCIPRLATPAEVARAVIWLCSDDAAMVTGHVLPVDGGWNAR